MCTSVNERDWADSAETMKIDQFTPELVKTNIVKRSVVYHSDRT